MTVRVWVLLAAALLLSLERLGYAWVWRWPRRFAALAGRLRQTPVGIPDSFPHRNAVLAVCRVVET